MEPALRIAICEDRKEDEERLRASIAQSGFAAEVEAFSSGEAFLKAFARGKYDILFLDIYMQALSGVETAERVRALDRAVVIVFATTSEDFTREGYRLGAYKYILKPVDADDVQEALEIAALKRRGRQDNSFTIATRDGLERVAFDDIYYISVDGRDTALHFADHALHAAVSIDALEKSLPAARFLRCHRAYIVNLDHVRSCDEDFIMENGDKVYIRVRERKRICARWKQHVFENMRGRWNG